MAGTIQAERNRPSYLCKSSTARFQIPSEGRAELSTVPDFKTGVYWGVYIHYFITLFAGSGAALTESGCCALSANTSQRIPFPANAG